MERNPKDRGYGYKKSYNYEDSIKETEEYADYTHFSKQVNKQSNNK